MTSQRPNSLRSWFADVGYLYLVVAAFVVIVFAIGALRPGLSSPQVGQPRAVDTHPWSAPNR